MAALSDLSSGQRIAITIGAAALVTVAAYFLIFKTMEADNNAAQARLNDRIAKNDELKQYEPRTRELEQQIVTLKQQLQIQKTIVPDEKEAPGFIHIMQNSASQSGIEIRRFTPKPVVNRDYYTEVPFEIDIDGTYYQLLDFFNRVAKLERIVNVEGLQISAIGQNGAVKGVKHAYPYSPRETVAVSCTAKSFYSHDAPPPPPPAPVKK